MSDDPQEVVIVDFQMRFGSIVWLMVKCAIAAIPAILILALILFILGAFFVGILNGVFGHH